MLDVKHIHPKTKRKGTDEVSSDKSRLNGSQSVFFLQIPGKEALNPTKPFQSEPGQISITSMATTASSSNDHEHGPEGKHIKTFSLTSSTATTEPNKPVIQGASQGHAALPFPSSKGRSPPPANTSCMPGCPALVNTPGMKQLFNSHQVRITAYKQPALTGDSPLWQLPSTLIRSLSIHVLSQRMDCFPGGAGRGAVAWFVTVNCCQGGWPECCSCWEGRPTSEVHTTSLPSFQQTKPTLFCTSWC